MASDSNLSLTWRSGFSKTEQITAIETRIAAMIMTVVIVFLEVTA